MIKSDFFTKAILKLRKRPIYYNYNRHCTRQIGHALLYYKTEPLYLQSRVKKYTHTNNWEVLEILRILNHLGLWVDVIDRNIQIENLKLEDKYEVFIGLGAGNSGKYFPHIAEMCPNAVKIFYAAGPEPEKSNELIKKRYEFYSARRNNSLELRRMITEVDIHRAMNLTDAIFCVGNEFSMDTYREFGKPIFRLFPSSSPNLHLSMDEFNKRSSKEFLYFGGNGNVVKGLDLLLETFSELPQLQLHVCASDEKDFNHEYREIIANCKNIHLHGFTEVCGPLFWELTSQCGYAILPSCSEGTATSVTTVMRRGLIPVVTYESGIDIDDFGFLLRDLSIDSLQREIKNISDLPKNEFLSRQVKSYLSSMNYTQMSFSHSFESGLLQVLLAHGRLYNER